jgi:hypothetical protein
MTSEVLLGCIIHMVPFQKIPLSNLVLNGIVNFNKQLEECSSQEILAALMLHHPKPELMKKVLSDLSSHQNCWNSFVMGPSLPSTDRGADPGSLACLRDLWTGWGGNTLYILVPFSDEVRSLQNLAKNWAYTDIKILTPQFVRFLLGMQTMRHHLLVVYWERAIFLTEEMDFGTTYGFSSQQFDRSLPLSECLPQALVTELLFQWELKKVGSSKIVDGLQTHADLLHSFIAGPQLPKNEAELTNCLRGLSTLPSNYSADCIYVWSRSTEAAEHLKLLSQTWDCKAATILSSPETSRLLAFPKGPPVVVIAL